MNERTKAEVVKSLLMGISGGVFLGGGVGLANFIRDLDKKVDEEKNRKNKSDTLYVTLPEKVEDVENLVDLKKEEKKANEEDSYLEGDYSSSDAALATLVGILGGGASYYGVRSYLQNLKRERKREELKEEQNKHFTLQHLKENPESLEKTSNSPGSLSTALWTALFGSMIASGVATNKSLDYYFGDGEKDTNDDDEITPRKIVYSYPEQKVQKDEDDEDDEEKTDTTPEDGENNNAKSPDNFDEDYAVVPSYSGGNTSTNKVVSASVNREYLLRNIHNNEKQAAASQIKDLVNAVALGKQEELKGLPVDKMFNKAASYKDEADDLKKDFAMSYLSTDGYFGNVLEPILAAETLEELPVITKAAAFFDKETSEIAERFAEGMVNDCRTENMCKAANTEPPRQIQKNASEQNFSEDDLAEFYSDLLKQSNIQEYVQTFIG